MKSSPQMNAPTIGLLFTAFSVALGQTYGPQGCVSISRSQQGTCVIATNCEDGVNLDTLEFAFDCQTKAQIQKHSFGVGGFDSVEEFDTGIKCAQCKVPQNSKVHKVTKKSEVPKKSAVHMFAKRSNTNEDALVDKYGPGDCVETYRSTTGTCMVKTQCKNQDINNYDFGLLCVHNVTSGENVRHLFGKNSFDPEEEFDTLIKCEKCLGLRAEAAQAAAAVVDANVKSEDLVKKVNTLVDEVGAMQTGLEKIKDDVKVLNEKVPKLYTDEAKKEGEAKEDESSEGEAKEGESKDEEKKEGEGKDEEKKEEKKDEDTKEGETEEKKAELFLSHHRSKRHIHKKLHQKMQQKHHHKKHRSTDEDEDNDDSKADDEGSDDSSSSQKDAREEDEDDSKDKDEDQGQEQDQDQEDSDDKKVDDDARDSEEAN